MYISRMQIFMNSYRSQHLYFYVREEEMAINNFDYAWLLGKPIEGWK